jgi:murein DD-endopeptidase MepM/ murein hydrolase activator NlpD
VVEKPAALDTLRTYLAEPAEEARSDSETGSEGAELSNLAYVLYSDQNLPENVSMEQAILDFDYCTPVAGVLSSTFGYREHPIEGEERFHYGVDLAADTGTAVGCFADGTVTAVGESSSYGKYCVVAHAGGYSTLYAHCSRVSVSSGADVTEGQKIAEVGETGMATGPHLHFELHQDSTYLNPIYYVTPV